MKKVFAVERTLPRSLSSFSIMSIAELATMVAKREGAKLEWNAEELATSLMALTHGIALQRAADPVSVSADLAGKAIQLLLTASLKAKQMLSQVAKA